MLTPNTAMAVPVVKTVQDCADWSKTVEPYIPQLYALPAQIASSITSTTSLAQLYASTNPVISAFAFSCALFPVFLLVSEINKNYSQVDRVWSILPTVYNIHYAVWATINGLPTAKVYSVMVFSVIWSVRLTFNYWRRGGYQIGSEDYRWALIKEKIGQPWFFLLNVLFVSSLQSVLLMAATTPTYVILLSSRLNPTLSGADVFFRTLLIGLVVVEVYADGGQWEYHEAKHQYQKSAKVPEGYTRAQLDRGFNTTGLFKYSRHPNFAAEQAIWLMLYQWACWNSMTFLNWTVIGAIAYLGVFAGSTPLTERISKSKYPEYGLYQERVGKFVPKLFGKGWDEAEIEKIAPKYVEKVKAKEAAKKKG